MQGILKQGNSLIPLPLFIRCQSLTKGINERLFLGVQRAIAEISNMPIAGSRFISGRDSP
jgi:hypothetical protein